MELQTISEVSKSFNISTRTLRYYEQIGLIQPTKREDFAYRTYDENTISLLSQIIMLRKLRIPLKQIVEILKREDTVYAISVFQQNLNEIEDEINSLSAIKNIIIALLERLHLQGDRLHLLDDENLLEIVDSLSVSKNNLKENKKMDNLNNAIDKLSKLNDKDVRIVYLPPATIAAYRYEGESPEWHVAKVIDRFVQSYNLVENKPDLRHFGFNSPNPKDETGYHGYEMFVTIPRDMDIPAPLVKKSFAGGVYAAHMIPMGAFDEWELLSNWLEGSIRYEYNGKGNADNMFDCLEETLNYANQIGIHNTDEEKNLQLDLLIPIKEKRG